MSNDSSISPDREQIPLQYIVYPIIAVVIALLITAHVCRILQRRRLRRRQGLGLDRNNVNDYLVTTTGEETVTAKLVRPRMYEVYLDSKKAQKIDRDVGWNDIMPLASNINVHVLLPSHPTPSREPWLSEASRLNSQVMFDSIKSAILSGLELLSLYNRRADRELRARNNDRDDLDVISHIPEPPLDLNLPRELVTGVMILMPSVHRTLNGKQESREEERLPDVAIGLKDKEWKGRIDVKVGTATRR